MKVLLFSNIPSPYFVEYLNELGKMADVKAVFERRTAKDRDDSWKNVNANNFSREKMEKGYKEIFDYLFLKIDCFAGCGLYYKNKERNVFDLCYKSQITSYIGK